jgi:PilZ domain-containing protein
MLNRRQSRRLSSLLEGRITIDGKDVSIPCTIRDLSATGARIWLQDVNDLPCEFDLTISVLGQTIPVRPVWFKGRTIGVLFAKVLNSSVVPRSYSQSVGASGLKTNPGAESNLPHTTPCSAH